jgi:hypothetical protein
LSLFFDFLDFFEETVNPNQISEERKRRKLNRTIKNKNDIFIKMMNCIVQIFGEVK